MIIDYSCDGESIEFVCGDNGVTYDNNCQLRYKKYSKNKDKICPKQCK